MSGDLYRKEAVDHLVSNEELDEAPQYILFQGRILVLLLMIALAVGGLYGYFVKVPIAVNAEGIFWSPQGIKELMVNSQGVIRSIAVSQGDLVKEGDLLIVVDQTDLESELKIMKAERQNVLESVSALKASYERDRMLRKGYREKMEVLMTESQARLSKKVNQLLEREAQLSPLKKSGLLEVDRYESVKNELNETREKLTSLQREKANQTREDALSELQLTKEIDAQIRAEQLLEQKILKLQKTIEEKSELRSPFTGRVTELKVTVGDFLSPGHSIATISPDNEGESLVAIVYASYKDGKTIEKGMRVELEPSPYPKSRHGVLVGEVESISMLPLSTTGMMRALKNDLLVKELSGEGSPFQLVIKLGVDADDPSGYRWTSEHETSRILNSGMKCSAQVATKNKRIIDLFLPEY